MDQFRIVPGSMGAAAAAVDLFGSERVDGGSWTGPVYVNGVKAEEIKPATELLAEIGCKLEKIPTA